MRILGRRRLHLSKLSFPEPEFFLFRLDQEGRATLEANDKGSYFDLPPIDRGEEARRDMVETLQKLGFEVEASHHECAPGQHEIDFKYTDALCTEKALKSMKKQLNR